MLRRSSLVECVSVLHAYGTGVYKASIFFYSSVYVQPCLSKNAKYTFYTIKSSLTLAYYEGSIPGKRKRELVKIDDEKKKQKSKEYETKRSRVFCDSWSKDRKWLKYVKENKAMTCVLCIQHVNEIIENKNLRGQNT